ncbi:MAG: UDP-N-acetylglucosamine 1-carboxyvinyltransferase, partial [Acidobacteria bacterium]|nr:UDP-N-acetylglucosamine 1-carboxyvinyltransferase [Acidobacteriota bacterium]
MDKLRIEGGRRLEGSVRISGAKNMALPAMTAALLTPEPVTLRNVPHVRDVLTMKHLLESMGARVEYQRGEKVVLQAEHLHHRAAPYDLVKMMRASILVLGPLVSRFGHAKVSLPGGCAIGARPINLHIGALEKMGVRIQVAHGYVDASCSRIQGAEITFPTVTVTGTENILMAAALAEGMTVLNNAAREPEVADLAGMLNCMGARIQGAGTSTIRVEGVDRLRGVSHTVIPDRIETGTFLTAALVTHSDIGLEECNLQHVMAVVDKLKEVGAEIDLENANRIRVRGAHSLRAADLTTNPFPGFPTDLQAQYMALMTQAQGVSVITETIFENRFMHALELIRMGADIRIEGNRAVVRGGTHLTGANVIASDLRASASLLLAGLVADGTTVVDRVYHLDRGYERIEEKLTRLGARV